RTLWRAPDLASQRSGALHLPRRSCRWGRRWHDRRRSLLVRRPSLDAAPRQRGGRLPHDARSLSPLDGGRGAGVVERALGRLPPARRAADGGLLPPPSAAVLAHAGPPPARLRPRDGTARGHPRRRDRSPPGRARRTPRRGALRRRSRPPRRGVPVLGRGLPALARRGLVVAVDAARRGAAPALGSLAPLQAAGGVVDPRVGSGPIVHSFVGAATLILAMSAVVLRAPRAPFLALLAVGAWILTLGDRTPLLALLKAVPPFHLFRMPTKFFLITELAVICLAALGLGRLASGGRRLRTGVAVALALAAVGERAVQSVLRFRAYEEVTAAGEPLATRIQLLADHLLPWARLRDGSAPPPRVLVDAPVARFGNLAMIYGVESLLGGVPGLLSPRHDRLDRPLSPDELDALGVELVFSPAWACPPPRLPGFVVVSSRGMCLVRNPHRPTRYDFANAGDGSVEVTAYRPGDVELRVATRSPRAILARESWKAGWRAQVDGRPAPIHPAADGLFFTVDVLPGVHLVRLTYRQPGLALGIVGAGSWLGLVLAGAWARHRRMRGRPGVDPLLVPPRA